ncbi:MAG: hypothetical protein AB8C46_01295 [Burkholderiaceae bacterium]
MSTLWRIAGMLALATGLIMLINSCSVTSSAASLWPPDPAPATGIAAPKQMNSHEISPHLLPQQEEAGLAIAGPQPNFDARPLQFKDGTSLEVETLAIG